MNNEVHLEKIKQFTQDVLSGFPDVFLVKISIKPVNNIKVFADTDPGISIDTCIRINRLLYKKIEEAQLYPEGDYSLEVSSPGLGEPLLLTRQYKKSVGKLLSLKLKTGLTVKGMLQSSTEDGIVLEIRTGKGKKEIIENQTYLYEEIEKALIEVVF
jgi:ribosome maturation factor RimP